VRSIERLITLCAVSKLCVVWSTRRSTALCVEPVWPFGQSTGRSIGPVVAEQLLCVVDRATDRYLPFFSCTILCMASRPTLCLWLCLIFYLVPLNSNLCVVFFDELKNSTNKILYSLPTILHLGEDFSNLSRP